jgi:site-specific recombinase XerD
MRTPKYRRQPATIGTDLAFIEVRGQRVYLGAHGSKESRDKYKTLLAEIENNGGRLAVSPTSITVVELCARFWAHAQTHYRLPDGKDSSELDNYKAIIVILKTLYGGTQNRVTAFGPLALKACRGEMVKKGWLRGTVNRQVSRLRHIFAWGVENEMVPVAILQALQAVQGLRSGKCAAADSEPVLPAPTEAIEGAKKHIGPVLSVLIDVQKLTGARAGELVGLRPCDLNRSGRVWVYEPKAHKTAHRGRKRTIYFGPRAQAALAPLMFRDPAAFIFQPRETLAAFNAACKVHRRPNQKPNKKATKRKVRDHYDVDAYRRAIARACKKAGVEVWSPHRLRHNAGTELRAEFGIELARIILGHKDADMTLVYAEAEHQKALAAMEKVG